MVKNKKLSKSSVAIIVLALLLIASLVMGMTGAWFTSQKQTGNEKELVFGVIKVTPAGGVIDQQNVLDLNAFLPGDELPVGQATITNEGEDAYVLYRYQLELSYMSAGQDTVAVADDVWTPLPMNLSAYADQAEAWLGLGAGETVAFADGEWHWVLVEEDHMLTFDGFTYTFNPHVENYVYDNTENAEKQYILNFGDDGDPVILDDYDDVDLRGVKIKLEVKLETKAIQAKNINVKAGASYTNEEKAAIQNKLNAQADAWFETNRAESPDTPTTIGHLTGDNLPAELTVDVKSNGVTYSAIPAAAEQDNP